MKEEFYPDFLPDNLKDAPGSPEHIQFCESLIAEGNFLEALYVALRCVCHSDDNAEAKLLLAKILFRLDCVPYAVREIEDLNQSHPHISSIARLLEKIAPGGSTRPPQQGEAPTTAAKKDEETLAEGEFDFSDIELLEDD